jgi:DNA-directed RNA polymerase subunit RPC12/RpoP
MTKLINYRCTRCSHDFEGLAGPTECPNCGFTYVTNMDVPTVVYEETTAEADDAFVPCMDDSCVI